MAFYPRGEGRAGEIELFVQKVAIVASAAVALLLLWAARQVLILVFIAAVLAAGIAPAVQRVRVLARFWFHRPVARGTAVVLVYFPLVATVILLGVFLVPRLIVESRGLAAQFPQLLERNILTPLERFVPLGPVREYLTSGLRVSRPVVFFAVKSVATIVGSFVAVLFMIAYMLIDAHRLRNLVLLLYPPDVRADRRRTMNRMARRMSSWLSGQLILSAIIGVATFIGLLLLRVPYALPLAILATIGEMVPVIGPILGAIPALIVALLLSRWQFWSVLAMAVLLQKAENLFIAPRVMARKVAVSPLAIFIAFMTGASILGILGAVMAIPVAAILQVTFDEIFVARRERRQDLVRAGTLLRRRD